MWRSTLAGLRAHTWRLVATALAVVLGVGFVAGTLIFADTAKAALYDQYARVAKDIDVAARPAGGDGRDADAPVLAPAALEQVRAVPGVAAAAGRMREPLPLLDRSGRLVHHGRVPGVAISTGDDARLRGYDLAGGRAPAEPGEAALDRTTADRLGLPVGGTITVLDAAQRRHQLRLVGLVDFGASKQYADRSVVVLDPADMTGIAGARGYREIVAGAAAGVGPGRLAARVRAVLPDGTQVRTGEQERRQLANDAISELDTFLTVLQIFAGIAVIVSVFVIYNTFTILLAQRVRELALLRCVGASRPQLLGSVLTEAGAVGLVGGLLGLALGFAVAYGMFSGAGALGAGLPRHPLALTPVPVLVAPAVGVLATVVAAVLPAVRATRVPPLAALRPVAGAGAAGPRRRIALPAVAGLVLAAGAVLTVLGERGRSAPEAATIAVVAGGVLAFLAVVLFSPRYVGPLTAVLGWLPGRLFGPPVRLASANARRNPGRAAATTAALMIGIGLMAGATVLTETVRAAATAQLASHYPVDYLLQPADTGRSVASVPADAVARLRADHTFGVVGEVRLDEATSDGRRTRLGAVDPAALRSAVDFPLTAGSLAGLGPGKVLLFTGASENAGRRVGDRVSVVSSAGRRAQLTVVALASGTSNLGDTLVSWDDFGTLRPRGGDDLVLVKAAAGTAPAVSRAALDRDLGDYPTVEVTSLAQWRDEITRSVDQIITVIAALLAFAILIALIGIANTLSLSVFERTRESATTRALGLTRGQLRATLLVEAVLMALVGAVVGVAFGIAYGWLTARVMFSAAQPVITIPVGELATLLGVAALAAVLAAVLPARRAARASIVSAMAET